ncbi:MAG TPA: phosphoribosylaminoimidazolesuccinocarboxamide synthase, partial [Thermomicrobiales bacterium]|nr:phosphoribosylaminoimidazolesuccinocarboxamide synthase [Thermomicrobiales bacterium]
MTTSVVDSTLPGLTLFRRGKVRDTFLLGDDLLMVASDRISSFDVVLPTLIPGKGEILTQLSRFWFGQTSAIVPNHLIPATSNQLPDELDRFGPDLPGRAML